MKKFNVADLIIIIVTGLILTTLVFCLIDTLGGSETEYTIKIVTEFDSSGEADIINEKVYTDDGIYLGKITDVRKISGFYSVTDETDGNEITVKCKSSIPVPKVGQTLNLHIKGYSFSGKTVYTHINGKNDGGTNEK